MLTIQEVISKSFNQLKQTGNFKKFKVVRKGAIID